jgi:hypothetical protein
VDLQPTQITGLESSASYYALIKNGGKQFRRSLKTRGPELAGSTAGWFGHPQPPGILPSLISRGGFFTASFSAGARHC